MRSRRTRPRAAEAAEPARDASPWRLHGPLTDQHRGRLVAHGVPDAALDRLRLREVGGLFPPWWHAQGNAFYLEEGTPFPTERFADVSLRPVSGALVVLASDLDDLAVLSLGGDDATVFVGARSLLHDCEIHCGAGSSVVLVRRVTCTARGSLDARNGGAILAGADQLWASDVLLATDDMHRLEDAATGQRLNGFGGRIVLGEHVWLGRDAVLTGNVALGDNCVVGMRSLVRNKSFDKGTAVAGMPARAIRDGVTWTRADTP